MEINDVISYSLIIGVVLSILLIVSGVVLLFVHDGAQGLPLKEIASTNSLVNSSTITPYQVVAGVPKLDGLSFIYLGLMVLIATPVVRVALLIGDFIKNKDLLYVILSVVVFINMMIAIFVVPAIILRH
ncbi:putative membrane protein [Metallosphaera yellowstonensis MK1]|uniref:Putative membrane protein n=1 Tax=Metallosphaera yellowstonensis MK1 TaxID=671065 RepID=H2C3Q6_9CREN|nr:DUF1634 domain-containing protein [Metallosphaera yellowstonensis]EHP70877.1 putative membrane protein [Metallosphaera yellowstonensis MK1]